ncbi:unnamed protein product [Musa acuminata subsp. burmannicoides]
MSWLKSLVGLQLVTLFLSVSLVFPAAKGAEMEMKPSSEHPVALPLVPPPIFTIAAEGVIYCRCKLPRYSKAVDGAPLPGAVVLLKCGSQRTVWAAKGRTDSHGYFYLQTQLKYKSLSRTCRVFVLWSPVGPCQVPWPYGLKGRGASLMFERKLSDGYNTIALYTAGFFVFGPVKSSMCYLPY